jgi:cellulose 1,4-beta-cellobiosidase
MKRIWLTRNYPASGKNCYDGNEWTDACTSNDDCTSKCAVEGADYSATYGVSTSGNALTLQFVKEHQYGKNIGSRLYLMSSSSLNSALYLVAMEPDGGMASYPTNKAGAKYGTGYCDAQCARDLKFVGGKANYDGWKPSSNDANAGVGPFGGCCAEIDIWYV